MQYDAAIIGADGVYLVGEATGFIGAGSCIRRGCARSSCEAASRASACAAQRRTDCDRITLHCRRRRREHRHRRAERRPLVAGDSNPGRIRSSLGGVGRNIAHNLALLGAKVRLITALGADDGAKRVEASCADLGIDLSDSLYVPDGATSTYLFLADSNGDMALAMNDMAIYEQMTPAFLETKLNALNAAALVVLDTNLSAESIRYLGEHCTAPLFADPVSAAKAGKLEPILGRLHTLKPNRMEAELLSGVTVTDEASLYRAADTLLAAGLQRVFLSLGADGVLAADHERKIHLHNLPARMVNTTGCGDAFMAAVARAFLDGADLETAAKRGLAASAIAMESADTINPAMSLTAVAERIQ